jgi:hypothetical protein
MAYMTDLANPKNFWLLMYERSILNQFLGLLVEMNASAKSMTYRYELTKQGDIDGPTDSLFDKESYMQKHALNGIGAALIIGADLLIKDVHSSANRVQSRQIEDAIPKLKEIAWEDLIRAAGNYVRHGDEWQSKFRSFCEKKGVTLSLEDRPEVLDDFLEEVRKEHAYWSIKKLRDFGLRLETHVLVSHRIWDMADAILLTEVKESMDLMKKFVDSFRYRPRKKNPNAQA